MSYSAKKHIKNITNLADYSFSPQYQITTTLVAYNGTELTYTPTSNATKVVIEVSSSLCHLPDGMLTLTNTRLQESTDGGSTWSDLDGFKLFEGNESGQYNTFITSYTFILPAYSGSKKFRLAGRSKSTSSEYSFGYGFNETTGGAPLYGAVDTPAHISIYSLEA